MDFLSYFIVIIVIVSLRHLTLCLTMYFSPCIIFHISYDFKNYFVYFILPAIHKWNIASGERGRGGLQKKVFLDNKGGRGGLGKIIFVTNGEGVCDTPKLHDVIKGHPLIQWYEGYPLCSYIVPMIFNRPGVAGSGHKVAP